MSSSANAGAPLQEALSTAVALGPRGVVRAVQAGQAVARVTRDYVVAGATDPPQVPRFPSF